MPCRVVGRLFLHRTISAGRSRRRWIHIVALHNHMIGEQPAFYFTHFWGKGPARELAQGIRAALEAQQQAGQPPNEAQRR